MLILTSCSLDKNSAYWNEDSINRSIKSDKLSNVLKNTTDFKNMTFEEFNLHIIDYANKGDYPDINN